MPASSTSGTVANHTTELSRRDWSFHRDRRVRSIFQKMRWYVEVGLD